MHTYTRVTVSISLGSLNIQEEVSNTAKQKMLDDNTVTTWPRAEDW